MLTTTESTQERAIVAVYDEHAEAEAAIRALHLAGLDMKRLSIIGKNFHTEEHAVGFYTTGDRVMVWGGRGALWGGLWGILIGGAFLFVPGVGPLAMMGPVAVAMIAALEGAVVGGATGALAAAFAGIGIPDEGIVEYETAVKAGSFLVIARGTDEMIVHAQAVLGTTGARRLMAHSRRPEMIVAEARRAAFNNRESILKLLSDDENARVATAETERLAEGDEFLDLEQLERGVQLAHGPLPVMSRVLPRKSVQEATWGRILTQLGSTRHVMSRLSA